MTAAMWTGMARWLNSHISPRRIVLAALGCWLLISVYMLVALGEELDMDAVFPGFENPGGRTISYGPLHGPTPTNPPSAVVAAFVAVGVVVGLPAVLPRRWFSITLNVSAIMIGLALAGTILRLGILLAPVLALQVWALTGSRDTTRR